MAKLTQRMDRRTLIRKLASTATFLGISHALPALHHAASRGKRLGIVIHSYAIRGSRNQTSSKYPPFKDAIELLEHVHTYGAGGVQTKTSGWSRSFAKRLRKTCEELDLFLEGSISAPKTEADVERFESEVAVAKDAGVTVFRTAMGGRRYDDFDSFEDWKQLKESSWKALRLAEPVMRKHKVKLAVENHKDWEVSDLLEFMEGLDSRYAGVTIDTGNSISLLEHPDDTVAALAKYGVTTHIKDMGVREYQHGFLLSEVPLGQGFLDMESILNTVEKHNPSIRFCLEMITRNPLEVPCKTEKYWATFGKKDQTKLEKALAWIRSNSQDHLPGVEGKSLDEKIEYEELNNRISVRYAEKRLGLVY